MNNNHSDEDGSNNDETSVDQTQPIPTVDPTNASAEAVISTEVNGDAENSDNTHRIYYRNQFSLAYKTDERILHQIINNNIECVNPEHDLKLIIYYKNSSLRSLLMKNDQHRLLTNYRGQI